MTFVRSTCYVSTGLQFLKNCHNAGLNKIIEATMLVNPYDDNMAAGKE